MSPVMGSLAFGAMDFSVVVAPSLRLAAVEMTRANVAKISNFIFKLGDRETENTLL